MTKRQIGVLCGFCLTFAATLAGCGGANEALVDGFYGGISDTVASIVMGALLSGAG